AMPSPLGCHGLVLQAVSGRATSAKARLGVPNRGTRLRRLRRNCAGDEEHQIQRTLGSTMRNGSAGNVLAMSTVNCRADVIRTSAGVQRPLGWKRIVPFDSPPLTRSIANACGIAVSRPYSPATGVTVVCVSLASAVATR